MASENEIMIKLVATDESDSPLVIQPGESGTLDHLFFDNGLLKKISVVWVDAQVLDLTVRLRGSEAKWSGMYRYDLELDPAWEVYSGDRLEIQGSNIGGSPTLMRAVLTFEVLLVGGSALASVKKGKS